jgi:putative transposase
MFQGYLNYNPRVSMICLKYRILPTKAQETALLATFAICREVYNSLVIERTAVYETTGQSLTYREQQNVSLKSWKAKFPELSEIHSQVLQNVAMRVDLAFKAFFRRVKAGENPGYPRLKGRGVYDSITFPQAQKTGCKLDGSTLNVSKIGQVKSIVHRLLTGNVKTCTIRRQAGKWFACFACEVEDMSLPGSTESIGIDMGLNHFAALSDGSFVGNPRFFRKDEKALAKAARKQAKTKKQSRERRKANKILSRIHERIRNRRHDFVHQLSRRIVNQYGLISVEKLNVKGMIKNHALAKSISDVSWSMFRSVLSMKAESAARRVLEIDPAYTSQDCHQCGNRAKKTLKERWHHCPICGASLDRDTNAAINILRRASAMGKAMQTAVGQHSVVGLPA